MKETNRRQFIKQGTVAAAVAVPLSSNPAQDTGGGTLRVGLIGCGGRGTGAAAQALKADKNVKLYAMADAFSDKIESSLKNLSAQPEVSDKLEVSEDRRFTGFDAYKKVTDEVDVVLLTTPPHFRPIHLDYAIERGRHVFAEKPVAVDGAGVRSVLASCEKAKRKFSRLQCLSARIPFGRAPFSSPVNMGLARAFFLAERKMRLHFNESLALFASKLLIMRCLQIFWLSTSVSD